METNDHVSITTASSETRFNIETSLLDDLSGARDSSASIPGVSETRFNVEASLLDDLGRSRDSFSSIPGVSETCFNVEASLLDDLGRSRDSEIHPAETTTASGPLAKTRFNIETSLHLKKLDTYMHRHEFSKHSVCHERL